MEALQFSTRAARDRRRRSTSPICADPDDQDRVGQRRRTDSGAVADQPRSPAPRLPSPTTVALAAGSTSTPPAAGTGGFAGSGAGLGVPYDAYVITSPPLLRRLGASVELIRCVEQGRYQDADQEAACLHNESATIRYVGDGHMPRSYPQAQADGSTSQAQAPASKAPQIK